MCGIAGILDLKGRAVEQPVLKRLALPRASRPRRRGVPRREQRRPRPRAGSASSTCPAAGQPMSNEDGTVWVTFNGEIYNYRELRHGAEGHGHRFATRQRHRGHRPCLRGVTGMPARGCAACSPSRSGTQRRRRLFLARDRLGKKPLVLCAGRRGQFVFASELQALLQHPGVRSGRELDPAALDEYLTYGYIPARDRIPERLQAPSGPLSDARAAGARGGGGRGGCRSQGGTLLAAGIYAEARPR